MSVSVEEQLQQLSEQAVGLFQQRQYQAAYDAAQQAFSLAGQHLGRNSYLYARSANNLAAILQAVGEIQAAVPLLTEALQTQRGLLSQDDPNLAVAINNLGQIYARLGRLQEAADLLSEAQQIKYRNLQTPNLPPQEQTALLLDYATTLGNLAGVYQRGGQPGAALRLYQEALDLNRQVLGEVQEPVAVGLNNLAKVYLDLGELARAESAQRSAIEIMQSLNGAQDPLTAGFQNMLGLILIHGGFPAEAEAILLQAAQVIREAVSETSPELATVLENLAQVYRQDGRYAQAEPLYHQILRIYALQLGEDSIEYASALNSQSAFYLEIQDYQRAMDGFFRTLQILVNRFGKQHPDVAGALNNMAAAAHRMEADDIAEDYARQAIEILVQVYPGDHYEVATCLNTLGLALNGLGELEEAARVYQQSLEMRRRIHGGQHAEVATSLKNLAVVHFERGEYPAAQALLEEALQIEQVSLGELHPEYAITERHLANVLAASGRLEEALQRLQRGAASEDRRLGQIFAAATESQRLSYLQDLQDTLSLQLSVHLALAQKGLGQAGPAFDLVLRRKGLSSEALIAQRQALFSGRYPHLRERMQALLSLRAQIGRKVLAGPGTANPEEHRLTLAQWMQQQEALEIELGQQIEEVRLENQMKSLDHAQLKAVLPVGSALIEFIQITPYHLTAIRTRGDARLGAPRYLAFVLAAGSPNPPVMIDLGEAAAIDAALLAYRRALGVDAPKARSGRGAVSAANRAVGSLRQRKASPETAAKLGNILRRLLFDPLAAHLLPGTRQLFLAPDGSLTRLPFEILPDAAGCLSDRFEISYLDTGRDLLRWQAPAKHTPGQALVLSDPDFELASTALQTGAPSSPAAATEQPARRSRSLAAQNWAFERLPGTQREGRLVAELLGAELLQGQQALESRLKACVRPRLLHLATHGFFLEDQAAAPAAWAQETGRSERSENPLLRSGLALAGANAFFAQRPLPEAAEDGLLTAEDVLGLDLAGTQLVVLSACETGLGDIQIGEGVFGLRRAFILAGTRRLVISLWKVPDEATQRLMARFYTALLVEGLSCLNALRAAQQALRQDPRYQHPSCWGAFILLGDPGKLS